MEGAGEAILKMRLQELAQKYGTTKVSHAAYMPAYEQHFDSIRYYVKSVLEIGIGDGSSLKMWKDYFSLAVIHGLDCRDCDEFEDDRICIWQADQADQKMLEHLANWEGGFDIIIDDGGHDVFKQQASLLGLWRAVKRCYVIEDLESSYWQHYLGQGTTVEFLKERLDEINKGYITSMQVPTVLEGLSGLAFYPNISFLFKT